MAIDINASTPVAQRRFNDRTQTNQRSLICKPGTGEVRIKVSQDQGQTYETVETINNDSEVKNFNVRTFDQRIEIECTGNAICTVSN